MILTFWIIFQGSNSQPGKLSFPSVLPSCWKGTQRKHPACMSEHLVLGTKLPQPLPTSVGNEGADGAEMGRGARFRGSDRQRANWTHWQKLGDALSSLYTEPTPELLKCFLDHLKLNKEKLCFYETTMDVAWMLRYFF